MSQLLTGDHPLYLALQGGPLSKRRLTKLLTAQGRHPISVYGLIKSAVTRGELEITGDPPMVRLKEPS